MRIAFVIFCFATCLSIAGPGRSSDVILNDVDNIQRRPLDPGEKAASVLFFYWHDCPVCNSYAPEINRICSDYTNFAFYIVQVDPDLARGKARDHAREYGLRAPILLDPTHRLVRLVSAKVTPEAIVLAKDGHILYRGRIDNLYAGLGKKRAAATQQDLRDALVAITAGKPVKQLETKAIGCLIETRR